MRIEFTDLCSFLVDLEEWHQHVHAGTVRYRIDTATSNESGTAWHVFFLATAVISTPQDGNWLLDCTESCGESTKHNDVSADRAVDLAGQLKTSCDACGLKLREGKIELY